MFAYKFPNFPRNFKHIVQSVKIIKFPKSFQIRQRKEKKFLISAHNGPQRLNAAVRYIFFLKLSIIIVICFGSCTGREIKLDNEIRIVRVGGTTTMRDTIKGEEIGWIVCEP